MKSILLVFTHTAKNQFETIVFDNVDDHGTPEYASLHTIIVFRSQADVAFQQENDTKNMHFQHSDPFNSPLVTYKSVSTNNEELIQENFNI